MKFIKKHLWSILYSVALTAFTVYVLLDAFVIERVYYKLDENVQEEQQDEQKNEQQSKQQSKQLSKQQSEQQSEQQSKQPNKQENQQQTDQQSDQQSELQNDQQSEQQSEKQIEQQSKQQSEQQSEQQIEQQNEQHDEQQNEQNKSTEPEITSTSYKDEDISIKLTTYRENNTDIYVADVVLSSADSLKTAFAKNTYGKNITQTTSTMAKDNDAILAINGDFYSARGGLVLRNGILYKNTTNDDTREALAIDSKGDFSIITEGVTDASKLQKSGIQQILSFGPALIVNNKINVSQSAEVDIAGKSNPRTAIGQIDSLHYVFLVSDGRTPSSSGLSLYQLAQFMSKLNVKTAYNLDGGGSSTMCFNGQIINNPTTNGKEIVERSVSDIVYIG